MNCVRYGVFLQPVEKQMYYLDKYGIIRYNYISLMMRNSRSSMRICRIAPPGIILVKSHQDAILTNRGGSADQQFKASILLMKT